jgi:hypothetical protein
MTSTSLYQHRRQAGVCVSCEDKPERPGMAHCTACLAVIQTKRKARRQAMRIEMGLPAVARRGHNLTPEQRRMAGTLGGRASGVSRAADSRERWAVAAARLVADLRLDLGVVDVDALVPALKASYERGYLAGYRAGLSRTERQSMREVA